MFTTAGMDVCRLDFVSCPFRGVELTEKTNNIESVGLSPFFRGYEPRLSLKLEK